MEAKALEDSKTDTLLDVRVRIVRHIELCKVRLKYRPMQGSSPWLTR